MAYAAVICLKKTIERLSNNTSCLPILKSSSEIEATYKFICFFKEELERLDKFSSSQEAFDALASKIREAAWKLQDVLDLHELGLPNNDEVENKIRSLTEEANKLVMECRKVEVAVESRTDESSSVSLAINGTDDIFLETWYIVGMAGIGKTTFALKVFENSIAKGHFDVHAFVAVGQKPELRDILLSILTQIGCSGDEMNAEKVEELGSRVYRALSSNSFILLLDDVWDTWVWKGLRGFLPVNDVGNRVLLTTRREAVVEHISNARAVQMPFLSLEESWDLFCANVFQEGDRCPHELVEVGKKIAKYCDGVPLAIITVAKLLSKAEKTVEYWLKVANEETSVFEEASEKMSPVLLPSYLYLPPQLKCCFIYLGVFPCKCTITPRKIKLLLQAEEFLEAPSPEWSLRIFAVHCMGEIHSDNLTISLEGHDFRLHFAFWYLCIKEAERSKFYKVLKRRVDVFAEGIERERRLCIQNNVLLGIKDTRKSLSCVSTARSVLCTGEYHPYPMPIFLDMKLLKVLDAETIRFCVFPVQLMKLVLLRYLALTCNQKLPASISKLCNLQHLIVKEHLAIRHGHDPTYLPMEIWDMKELKHLEVVGADLPEPAEDDSLLEKLSFLIGVTGHSCTKRVLERIPNLEYLYMVMELSPSGTLEHIGDSDNFHYLNDLRGLSCTVVNPNMSTPKVVHWPFMCSSFPTSLGSITLSGLGHPWTILTAVAMLPCLLILKVLDYGCRGSKWTVSKDDGFVKLEYLQIENTDLEHWEVEDIEAFPNLKSLIMKDCYKLNQLPMTLACNAADITLLDCNPKIFDYQMNGSSTSGHGKEIRIGRSYEC